MLLVATVMVLANASINTGEVPIHYNSSGVPDEYGSPYSLLFIPLIMSVVYALIWFVGRHPEWHNYPTTVTASNAPRLYTLSRDTMLIMRLLVASLALAIVAWQGFATRGAALPTWMLLVWGAALLGMVLYTIIKMSLGLSKL